MSRPDTRDNGAISLVNGKQTNGPAIKAPPLSSRCEEWRSIGKR